MFNKFLTVGFCIAVTGLASAADAATMTWSLQDVAFNDGGTASGSFSYDAATNGFSDINITTTQGSILGGNTYTFAGKWAKDNVLDFYSADASGTDLMGVSSFYLNLSDVMTDLGGMLSISGWSSDNWAEGICADADCNAYVTSDVRQLLAGGSITTTPSPVPLPAGGVLLLSGLAGIAALRRRKARVA